MGALNLNLGASNLNLNLNLASHAGGSSVGIGRVRFNTADYRKLLAASGPLVPSDYKNFSFPNNWDPVLKTYPYLLEFVEAMRAALGANWLTHFTGLAGADTPAHKLNPAPFEQQVLTVLDRAADRDDRFAEILDQHDADGAINYWLGMLMIDPGRHPKTHLLIRVAARIGEAVVMALKNHFMAPRPSQLCVGIVPMIDPPATPAFPAGHSLQSHLISKFLARLDAERPANERIPQVTKLLTDLANRVAENRVIAGIHFPIDNEAGRLVANECYNLIWPTSGATGQLGALVTAAIAE